MSTASTWIARASFTLGVLSVIISLPGACSRAFWVWILPGLAIILGITAYRLSKELLGKIGVILGLVGFCLIIFTYGVVMCAPYLPTKCLTVPGFTCEKDLSSIRVSEVRTVSISISSVEDCQISIINISCEELSCIADSKEYTMSANAYLFINASCKGGSNFHEGQRVKCVVDIFSDKEPTVVKTIEFTALATR